MISGEYKRVEKLFVTPGPRPNGLQAAPDGLWVIDQDDNHVYKLSYEDGSILARMKTDDDRASGITLGGGFIWVASTYNCKILKLDPKTGDTVAELDTPGAGTAVWRKDNPNAISTGAHGLEWVEDKLWVATPPSFHELVWDVLEIPIVAYPGMIAMNNSVEHILRTPDVVANPKVYRHCQVEAVAGSVGQ